MKPTIQRSAGAIILAASLAMSRSASADITVSSFANYNSDAVYASWQNGKVVSGATNFTVTAKGYGSNWKYLGAAPVSGAGNTTLQVTVDLSADDPSADGKLGVIVELIDGDGTDYLYAWYGQTLGHHVLTVPVNSPTKINNPGTAKGLDLNTLTHEHLQLDPSSYGGQYTIAWNDLSLTGAPAATK